MSGAHAAGPRHGLRPLLALARPVRGLLALVVVLTATSVVLTATGPLVLGRATDLLFDGLLGASLPDTLTRAEAVQALRDAGRGTFADVVAGSEAVPGRGIDGAAVGRELLRAVALYATAAVLQLLAASAVNRGVHRVVADLRSRAEDAIHRTPVAALTGADRGDVLSRVTTDVDNVTSSMTQAVGRLLTSSLTAVVVLGFMLHLSPLLTLTVLATLPVAVLATRALMRRSRDRFAAQWAELGGLTGHVEESLTGHETVVALHAGADRVAEFDRRNERLASEAVAAQTLSGLAAPLMGFVGNLGYVAICLVGGLRVASGTMTVGGVQAFVQYGRQFSNPVAEISGLLNELQSGAASARRLLELLDGRAERLGEPAPWTTRGELRLEGVDFGHTPGRLVLRGVDLHVAPGETVAVVGPTGAGKSTLVDLLLRFHTPDAGRVLLDGRDTARLDVADVRSRVGAVLQDTWVLDGTLADNIAYGEPGGPQARRPSRAEVERAARAAGVHSFADALPDGLDSHVGPDGADLSAGQLQLVALARAFLSDPDVLVLDEATSSVDPRTARRVQEAVGRLRAGRTCLVVAHRLATVRDADRVVVLDEGRVVETGTHDELLARRGRYWVLAGSPAARETAAPQPA